MHVEQVTSETGLQYRQFSVPARNPEVASGEMFAARTINGTKELQVQWTESLGQGVLVNRLAQAQELAGGPGSITSITGRASATFEANIKAGRFSSSSAAEALGQKLGGRWKVEVTPPPYPPGKQIFVTATRE